MKRQTRLQLTVSVLIGALLMALMPPAQLSGYAQTKRPQGSTASGTLHLPLVSAPLGPPAFRIISPTEGLTVSGTSFFAVQVLEPSSVATVSFQAGATSLGTDSTASDGFQVFLDASQFAAGALQLTATATGPTGATTTQTIDVTIVPTPPASATVGTGGTTLATASGNTIVVPPGAANGAIISVEDKTQEQVTAEKGIDWDALGVTFLGAIEVQSTAPLAKPLGVSSVGFGNRIQPGQAVVTYRILPDADGDGIGELVVVNGANLAPNGTLVSPPLSEIVVNTISAKAGDNNVQTAATAEGELHGPPGTTITIHGSGFNPLSVQGNVASFQSNVNGVTINLPADVKQNGADAADQTVSVLIPYLPPGAATLLLRNESSGATMGPINITVDAAAPLSQSASDLIDTFFAQSLDFVATLPDEADPQVDERGALIEQLTLLRARFETLRNDSSPEAQQFVNELAMVIEGSGVLNGFSQTSAAALFKPNECVDSDYKNQLTLLTNIAGVLAGVVCVFLWTGAGGIACGAIVAILVLIQGYRIGKFPDCPDEPPACTPTATAPSPGTTGMGAAPPPGGDSCGNVGSGPANSVESARLAQLESGRFVVKIFPLAGGRLLTPFTGVTDPGGYFYIPLIPQGEPFRALALDQLTGAAVSVEGIGPPTGESILMNFDFSDAQQNRYDITVGDTISDGVPGPGAGNIEEAGALDIYNFNVTAGQRVFFDVLDLNVTVGWELISPTGDKVFDTCLACGDPGAFTLTQAGTYTLTVGGENSTAVGTYQFKLWNVPPPQEFAITVGDTISNGVPGPGAGNIETPGVLDIYTFIATAGQRVFFDVLDLDVNIGWDLRGAAGETIFSECLACGDPGAFTLATAGVYTITVGRATSDEVGAYQFKLWNVPDSQEFAIAIGDTVSSDVPGSGAGNIETPGILDIYAFTATAGQRVFFDVLDLDVNIRWDLRGAGGETIFSECLACGDPGAFTLEEAGTYTITVGSATSDATGSYQFKLWNVPAPQEFAITIGDTISNGVPGPGAGNIETPGVQDIYTFDAAAGQRVFFDVLDLDVTVGWDLRAPAGETIFNECLACGDPGAFTLTTAGTYTITVGRANNDDVGTYQFKLEPQ